jgi:hypothetical protein
MKQKMNFKSIFGGLTLLFLAFAISITHTGCGPDASPVTPKDTTTTGGGDGFEEEFIIVDGVRYGADQIQKRQLGGSNTQDELVISFDNQEYPFILLEHQRESGGDTLVPREYLPEGGSSYDPPFDDYRVKIWFAEGPSPNFCQNIAADNPSTPHETYTLKKVNGKYVSEFGKAQLDCSSNAQGKRSTVEGYLIWEE